MLNDRELRHLVEQVRSTFTETWQLAPAPVVLHDVGPETEQDRKDRKDRQRRAQQVEIARRGTEEVAATLARFNKLERFLARRA
jgi:hypothetical protein